MPYLLILFLLSLSLYADDCESLYQQSKETSVQVDSLIKSNVAAHKSYEIINHYLDLSASTLAACAISDNRNAFRITRELNADMKRVAKVRERFRVQTFNELKEAAKVQAKKEVQCTNVYNNTYIQRRKKDDVSIQPIKEN